MKFDKIQNIPHQYQDIIPNFVVFPTLSFGPNQPTIA